jgi:hypothetical protein
MMGGVASVFGEAEDFEAALRIGERIRFRSAPPVDAAVIREYAADLHSALSLAARSSPVPPRQDRSCTGVVRNFSRTAS